MRLMKRSAFAVFLLALALASRLPAQESTSSVSEALRAAYTHLDAAYDRRDVRGILALYAPNFVRDDSRGTQNLAQTRQRLTDDFAGTQSVRATTRIKSLMVHGNQAEAAVTRRVDVILTKPLPDLPPPYFVVEVNQETWENTPNGWRLTAMGATPLRSLLRGMAERDQAIRHLIIADPKNPALAARMKAVDASDRAQMKQIIQKYGWPGYDLVGTTDASTAWLIVQHSDDDKAFQRRCLPLLQSAVRRGQAKPSDLAYLTDRILRGEGKPQIYGTQGATNAQGIFVPPPMEDPAHVDQRRASVGLPPLAEYLKTLQQMYHPDPKPIPPAPGK